MASPSFLSFLLLRSLPSSLCLFLSSLSLCLRHESHIWCYEPHMGSMSGRSMLPYSAEIGEVVPLSSYRHVLGNTLTAHLSRSRSLPLSRSLSDLWSLSRPRSPSKARSRSLSWRLSACRSLSSFLHPELSSNSHKHVMQGHSPRLDTISISRPKKICRESLACLWSASASTSPASSSPLRGSCCGQEQGRRPQPPSLPPVQQLPAGAQTGCP